MAWLINVCSGGLIRGVQNYIENKAMKQTSSSMKRRYDLRNKKPSGEVHK